MPSAFKDCAEEDADDDHGDHFDATDLGLLSNLEHLTSDGVIGFPGDVDAFSFFPSAAGSHRYTLQRSSGNDDAGAPEEIH